ncbi:MAG: hypothetical protein KA004_12055 [Verrucomicrobiales bacterium]|nr:hypothetical protein [Verrucomicrobiales bacterium]
MKQARCISLLLCAASILPSAGLAQQWNDFETPPHNYWETPPADAVTKFHRQMEQTRKALPADGDPKTFLRAYLKALNVPQESQILVFSKSSLQRKFVNGKNPRALYFNEDTYVGWMPGGLIEVAGIDPVLGGIFYIFNVPTAAEEIPRLERRDSCLGCHAGSPSNFLPGLMVRSLLTGSDGRFSKEQNAAWNGGHDAPFEGRWAGWLVSGELTGMRHLANTFSTPGGSMPSGLPEKFLPAGLHLEPGSDPAALLLHDHQVAAANRIMEANYRLRTAMHQAGGSIPVSQREIPDMTLADEQADRLLSYLLFAQERPLPGPVKGGARFAKAFAATRKADAAGRALKDLNLQTRILEYRCSYMIYSSTFGGLPDKFRLHVLRRLRSALTAETPPEIAAHLPKAERQAIAEILTATLPEFPR